MLCVVCGGDRCENTASCGCGLHLSCANSVGDYKCPACNIPWFFTSIQWDVLQRHSNDTSTTESDSSDSECDVDMSEIIDQVTIPNSIRHRRIEHKVINVDDNGKPKITVVTIPRRYSNSYMNRMFGFPRHVADNSTGDHIRFTNPVVFNTTPEPPQTATV